MDPEVLECEQLTVRWVKQQEGNQRRCRWVGGDFKLLVPNLDGLFTAEKAHVTERLMDWYAIDNTYSRVVGDACTAHFRTP